MTYDPVKIIERPKVGMFSGLPSAAPGSVLVVDREGHPVRVLGGPRDRLTAGEARWGQIRTLYQVDVTEHPLEFQDTFPCKDDIGGFRAVVRISCKVVDPEAIVSRGIHDVARVLFPPVTETLRLVCGEFAAENFQEAERAGLAAVRDLEQGPGHDAAFQIRQVSLVLTLDDAAATYVRERKETSRNRVRQEDAAQLATEKSRLEAELARTRDQLDATRARAAAEFEQERLQMQGTREELEAELAAKRQELELAQAAARSRTEQKTVGELELERLEFEVIRQQRQAELDDQRLQLDLARARLQAQYDKQVLEARLELDQMHVSQLTSLLNQGQWAALAMQLAHDPAAIGPVSSYIAEQRAADTNRQLQALQLLVENDGLEGWQITDQAKTILHQLVTTWSANSGQPALAADTPAGIEGGSPASSSTPSAQPGPSDTNGGEFYADRQDPGSSPDGRAGWESRGWSQ